MSKNPFKKDFEVKVDTNKVDVNVKKEGDNLNVNIDTPKVDVNITKDGEDKSFNLDSKKLKVQVDKTEEGTTVNVEAENNFLKRIGNWLSKKYSKKFNK
jgi:carbon monoxide dehydrogenase subunit G